MTNQTQDTVQEQNKMREAFEAYMGVPDVVLAKVGNSYLSDSTHNAWNLWKAAYEHAQKTAGDEQVTEETGYPSDKVILGDKVTLADINPNDYCVQVDTYFEPPRYNFFKRDNSRAVRTDDKRTIIPINGYGLMQGNHNTVDFDRPSESWMDSRVVVHKYALKPASTGAEG